MKPIDFIFLFGILGAICTAFALYYTWRQNRLSSDKTTKTLENTTELLQENKTLKEQVQIQSSKIDELRSENNELSSKLMDKSLDIFNNLTGGDSYCVLEVFFDAISGKPTFSLRHEGKIPLKNVQLSIEDAARRVCLINSRVNRDFDSPEMSKIVSETYYNFSFPSLYPNTQVNIDIPIEAEQTEIRMRIWIHLDNGNLFELLEVKNLRENKKSQKLELKRGEKVLYEWNY